MMTLLLAAVATAVGIQRTNYEVRWNDRVLHLESARISAMPFNRVWTGKQRTLDQTRMAKFTTFDMSDKGVLAVTFPRTVPRVTLYPLSKGNQMTIDGNRLVVRMEAPEHLVLDFDDIVEPLHVYANPPVAKPPRVGKVRFFGPGRHDAGVIVPDPDETIYLAEGAVVHAAVFIDRVENVRILGRGIFDFSTFERCDSRVSAVRRLRGYPAEDTEFACGTFVVNASTNVVVEGVVLRDAPFWNCIVRGGSRNVVIDNVKVIGAWRYNSDGVDVAGCEDVTVRNCCIRSFDDCTVVLDGYLDGQPENCRNVTFENNLLWCDWGANFKIWGGKFDCDISDIRFARNKLLCVQSCPFDIHCNLGCPQFSVRDVRIEDVEIDVTGPRLCPRLQEKDDSLWSELWTTNMLLCTIATGWPQKDIGNQGRTPMTLEEAERTVRMFDGISVRSISFPGALPSLSGAIKTAGPNQVVTNVIIDDVLPVKISRVEYVSRQPLTMPGNGR